MGSPMKRIQEYLRYCQVPVPVVRIARMLGIEVYVDDDPNSDAVTYSPTDGIIVRGGLSDKDTRMGIARGIYGILHEKSGSMQNVYVYQREEVHFAKNLLLPKNRVVTLVAYAKSIEGIAEVMGVHVGLMRARLRELGIID